MQALRNTSIALKKARLRAKEPDVIIDMRGKDLLQQVLKEARQRFYDPESQPRRKKINRTKISRPNYK